MSPNTASTYAFPEIWTVSHNRNREWAQQQYSNCNLWGWQRKQVHRTTTDQKIGLSPGTLTSDFVKKTKKKKKKQQQEKTLTVPQNSYITTSLAKYKGSPTTFSIGLSYEKQKLINWNNFKRKILLTAIYVSRWLVRREIWQTFLLIILFSNVLIFTYRIPNWFLGKYNQCY